MRFFKLLLYLYCRRSWLQRGRIHEFFAHEAAPQKLVEQIELVIIDSG